MVLALLLVLFGVNYMWTLLITPLFGAFSPMVALMADAVLRTFVMLALALFAVCRLQISDSVDAALAKCPIVKKLVRQ